MLVLLGNYQRKEVRVKIHLFFHFCDTSSESIHIPNNDRYSMCQYWVNRNIMNENECTCYHHKMITANYYNNVEKECDNFDKLISDCIELFEKK